MPRPATRMLILADDLTGAADCAVACMQDGLRASVVLDNTDTASEAEILSIDADTRRLDARQAADVVARLVEKHAHPSALLYKKIDSTLRGPIAAEIAASLSALRSTQGAGQNAFALLSPAFPATGRTTVRGHQLLHGQPCAPEASLDGDASTSDLAALVRTAHLKAELLELASVRSSPAALLQSMVQKAQTADVLVCDAETEDDLRAIAQASLACGRRILWVGSAGLARHLAQASGIVGSAHQARHPAFAAHSFLFVVGSGSPVSRQQTDALIAESDTMAIRVQSNLLLKDTKFRRDASSDLAAALNCGRDVALVLDVGDELDREMGVKLTNALGDLVRPLGNSVGALIATGGETARAVLDAWGIQRLDVAGEVETGVPFSFTSGWHREMPVLTKAGAFGHRNTFLHCRAFLRELASTSATANPQEKGQA